MEKQNRLKVVITKGLVASGKTTYAKKWVAEDPENRVRVEKDEIRKDTSLFKGGIYVHKRGDEEIVIKERDRLIHQALAVGKSVVSSDTNLAPTHIAQISTIANQYNAEVEVVSFLDVPLKELIERDNKRENTVGEQVIRRMFHQQVKTMPTFLKYDPNLNFCLISDLDGTLTTGPKKRSPYEWHKVGNDDINLGVASVIDGIQFIDGKRGTGHVKTFIFSGRDSVCRPETEAWLEKHDIEYDALYMRAEGDNRSDEIVKAEFIEAYIRDKYNVLIWFDDRPRIVTMLKDVYGINVAALGDQRFDF